MQWRYYQVIRNIKIMLTPEGVPEGKIKEPKLEIGEVPGCAFFKRSLKIYTLGKKESSASHGYDIN